MLSCRVQDWSTKQKRVTGFLSNIGDVMKTGCEQDCSRSWNRNERLQTGRLASKWGELFSPSLSHWFGGLVFCCLFVCLFQLQAYRILVPRPGIETGALAVRLLPGNSQVAHVLESCFLFSWSLPSWYFYQLPLIPHRMSNSLPSDSPSIRKKVMMALLHPKPFPS